MLGRHVGRLERRGDERVGRGGVDDAAPFLRLHARNGGADGVEGRRQVDRDDHVPLLRREILDRRDELDAGVVDENVDGSELRRRVGDHRLGLRALRHVGAVVDALDAELLFDGGARRLDRLGVAEAVDHHVRALLGERAGDRQSDPARGTGDDGVTFGERHIADLRNKNRLQHFAFADLARVKRSYCIAMNLGRGRRRSG